MFKIILFLKAILFSSLYVRAQNIVPNGDFEKYIKCPNSWVDVVHKSVFVNWFSPDEGTPDYYNTCGTGVAKVPYIWAGTQKTNKGEGMAGIYNWSINGYNEFLCVKFEQTLIKDSTYLLSFNFSNAKNAEYACFDIGLALSPDSVRNKNNLMIIDSRVDSNTWNPDNKWALINTTYKSKGTEKYLFIGNFHSNYTPDTIKFINNYVDPMLRGKSYMYIDEVVVEPFYKPTYPLEKLFVIENIYFEFDKSELKETSFNELERLLTFLVINKATQLTIIGHTDKIGEEAYNNKLSLERAEAVKNYLTHRNIANSRIITLGQGEYSLLEKGDTEHVRSKNRRVEFILSSLNN